MFQSIQKFTLSIVYVALAACLSNPLCALGQLEGRQRELGEQIRAAKNVLLEITNETKRVGSTWPAKRLPRKMLSLRDSFLRV